MRICRICRILTALAWLLTAVPLCAQTMTAESLPRDQIIPRISAQSSPEQRYALYLPPGYSRERVWPVLILLDPRGRAEQAIRLAIPGARRHGWIVFSSYNSRSDGDESITLNALQTLLHETGTHYAYDPKRIYLAGMSGTAKTLWVALPSLRNVVAGMIGSCGGRPPELGKLDVLPPAFYGMTGRTDFNYQEMRELETDLAKTGAAHHLQIFEGGHGWPGRSEDFSAAIDWLELMAIRQQRSVARDGEVDELFQKRLARAGESIDELQRWYRLDTLVSDFDGLHPTEAERAEAEQLDSSPAIDKLRHVEDKAAAAETRFSKQFDHWFTRFVTPFSDGRAVDPPDPSSSMRELRISSLQKQAQDGRTREAMSAQRRLERAYVANVFYLPTTMAARGDTNRASKALDLAARIFPDRAGPYWQRAAIEAGQNHVDAAFHLLEDSRSRGYLDTDSLRNDPDWQSLRGDPRWSHLLQQSAVSTGKQ